LLPENVQVPRILLVLVVPDEIERWIDQTEEKLSMYHCVYWESLRGLPGSLVREGRVYSLNNPRELMIERE
jgi:hypothetical protein